MKKNMVKSALPKCSDFDRLHGKQHFNLSYQVIHTISKTQKKITFTFDYSPRFLQSTREGIFQNYIYLHGTEDRWCHFKNILSCGSPIIRWRPPLIRISGHRQVIFWQQEVRYIMLRSPDIMQRPPDKNMTATR